MYFMALLVYFFSSILLYISCELPGKIPLNNFTRVSELSQAQSQSPPSSSFNLSSIESIKSQNDFTLTSEGEDGQAINFTSDHTRTLSHEFDVKKHTDHWEYKYSNINKTLDEARGIRVLVNTFNASILTCYTPDENESLAKVVIWTKNGSQLKFPLPGTHSQYGLLENGDLYIQNISSAEIPTFSCEIRDQSTGKTIPANNTSSRLKETEPSGPIVPGIIYNNNKTNSLVNVKQRSFVQLCCVSQAYPISSFSWLRQNEDGQSEPMVISDNIFPLDGCLIIYWTSIQHYTNYICQANNIADDERSIINLQLDSLLLPSTITTTTTTSSTTSDVLTIIVNTGESISCTVIVSFHHHIDSSLSPSDFIYKCINNTDATVTTTTNTTTTATNNNINSYGKWTHDHHSQRRPVKRSVRIIDDGSNHHSDNIRLDATLTADVVMSDGQQTNHIVPNFVDIFEEVVARPKELVSLRCILTGSPLPQITWSRDGISLADLLRDSSPRLRIADHVTNDGSIIGYLNITRIELNDEGEYKCHGISEAGRVEHSARVFVTGKPRLKTYAIGKEWTNVTLIAGRSAIMTCPINGYPIESMKWEHLQQILPVNHRQKIQRLSLKDQRSALQIENVQKHHDEGEYKCTAKGSDSSSITARIMVSVRMAPHIDIQPLPEVIYTNEGMRVKMVCSVVEGDPPVHIKWLKDGQPLRLSGNILLQNSDDYSLLTFKKIAFRDAGNYTCHAKNTIDHDSRTSVLIVNVPPKWILEPANETSIVQGSTVWINCSSDGHPPARISWKKFTSTSSSTSSSLSSTFTESSTAQSSTGSIMINSKQHPSNTVSIDTSSSNDFKDILSSYRHQVLVNGTLVIHDVDKSDSGLYMCQVSNGIGAGLSKVVRIRVLMPPYFENKFSSFESRRGEKSVLKCEVSGDNPISITWQKDKQVINFNTKTEKRYSLVEKRDDSKHGLVSLLEINPTERHDSSLFTCQATNNYGSDDTNIQLIVLERPEPPSNLELLDATSRSVRLKWAQPYHGNKQIRSYMIEYSRLDSDTWSQRETSQPSTDFILTNLTPITGYKVRVRAINDIGTSEASAPITVTTGEEVPGGPPLNVRLEASGAQSLKVRWQPPKKELRHGRIKGYYVGYRIAQQQDSYNYKNYELESERRADQNDESEMSTYVTNLRRRTTYEVVIQAYNSIGTGPRSDEIRMTTLQNSPPTTPSVHLISTSFDSITIGWNIDSEAGGMMMGTPNSESGHQHDFEKRTFIIAFKPDSSYEWTKIEINEPSNLNEYRLNGLKCGTKYSIYMIAKNSLGIGEPSKTLSARTKGGAPVSPTSFIKFASINTTSVHMNLGKWMDSGCRIQSFFIRYKQLNSKQWIHFNKSVTNSASKSAVITNLIPGKRYSLVISASSDAGITEAEYDFDTHNWTNAYPYPLSGESRNSILQSQASTSSSHIFRQYLTILLPVIVSILVLITLFAAILFCLRKQNLIPSNQVEISAFDRISCNSTNINSKCESGVEGVPMSDYQCAAKLKSFGDDARLSLSYYSSPARKNLGNSMNTAANVGLIPTTAIKGHQTPGSHHEYAEPFMRIASNRSLNDQYGCTMLVSNDDKMFARQQQQQQQNYASIKKKKLIRPPSLMDER